MKNSILQTKDILIAGPCSAESEEQLISTALELSKIEEVKVLRAGIWKPRTCPGGFEGVGTKGLAWLAEAKKQTGLLTATEVASPKHVEDALHFGVDVLWIGSRTSVNPFNVQAISDVLKGTDATVLIKNPVNPDVHLWAGAVKRIQQSGIENIGLVHRGFTSYGNKEFRNAPMWQIPLELKRQFPELPMICDPSHITGNSDLVASIAQKSIDLHFDGLIIESHISPRDAWTDKKQQITPLMLQEILSSLNRSLVDLDQLDVEVKIDTLRYQINQFDDDLLQLISTRMKIAERIGAIKSANKMEVVQTSRWNKVLEKVVTQSRDTQLSEEFVLALMELLHSESIRIQRK